MKNDSSMTRKNFGATTKNRYLKASDNDRSFVDAKTLDEIAGKELANKYRIVQTLVLKMVDGTTLEVEYLLQKIAIPRQRSLSNAVAVGIMQVLNLRGFKKIPRNEKSRNLVKFLFLRTTVPEYALLSI